MWSLHRILMIKVATWRNVSQKKTAFVSHRRRNGLLLAPSLGAFSARCVTIRHLYLLTPWSRVLLEKLASLQLVKKFPAFYGTRRFLTALTSARHLPLTWASPIQSSYPNPTSWRSILIRVLSSHLRLGLPSGLFPSGFPTSTLYTPFTKIKFQYL